MKHPSQKRIREDIREFVRDSFEIIRRSPDWPGKEWNVRFDCEPAGAMWMDEDDVRHLLRVTANLRRGLRMRLEALFVSLGLLTDDGAKERHVRKSGVVLKKRIEKATTFGPLD